MSGKRIGFIGCGEIARLHAACLLEHGAEIAGGYDLSPQAAERFVRDFGGSLFTDAESLCRSDDIDAVYVCTRHDTHVHFIRIAASSAKAVFCEKPLAMTERDAWEAADIVERSGILFALGFNHRYAPGIQRLKRHIEENGGLADALHVQFVTAPFLRGWAGMAQQGGGVLVCLGSHVFDLARYLAGSDADDVRSISVRRRLPEPYLEDAFAAIFTTKAGQLVTVHSHDYGNMIFSADPAHRINTVHAFLGGQAAAASVSRFECFMRDRIVRETFPTDTLTAWGYMEINRRFLLKLEGAPVEVPDAAAGIHAAMMVDKCRKRM